MIDFSDPISLYDYMIIRSYENKINPKVN